MHFYGLVNMTSYLVYFWGVLAERISHVYFLIMRLLEMLIKSVQLYLQSFAQRLVEEAKGKIDNCKHHLSDFAHIKWQLIWECYYDILMEIDIIDTHLHYLCATLYITIYISFFEPILSVSVGKPPTSPPSYNWYTSSC